MQSFSQASHGKVSRSRLAATDQTHSSVNVPGSYIGFSPPHNPSLAPKIGPPPCTCEVLCLRWPTAAALDLVGKIRHYNYEIFQLMKNSVHASIVGVFSILSIVIVFLSSVVDRG